MPGKHPGETFNPPGYLVKTLVLLSNFEFLPGFDSQTVKSHTSEKIRALKRILELHIFTKGLIIHKRIKNWISSWRRSPEPDHPGTDLRNRITLAPISGQRFFTPLIHISPKI
jgi:hypothetical protein